jgi:hypothetical protein
MITQELLQWGAKHSHSKVRQLAMHLVNLVQSAKADSQRMHDLSKGFQNMSVQLWVSARLNQELSQLLLVQWESAAAAAEAIERTLVNVLQEARDKGVPEDIIAAMQQHFQESIQINGKPMEKSDGPRS